MPHPPFSSPFGKVGFISFHLPYPTFFVLAGAYLAAEATALLPKAQLKHGEKGAKLPWVEGWEEPALVNALNWANLASS